MRRVLSKSFLITSFLSVAVFAQSQSGEPLGDVARKNRAEQQAQEAAGTMPKVITNQDLPAAPPAPESSSSDPMTMVSGVKKPDRYADQGLSNRLLDEQRAAQQWKTRIQAQENRVARLQAQVDRMNAWLNPPGSGVQYEGPHTRYQAGQMERLAQMQETLDQEKQRLYSMQEQARHVGMHTSVYDP